jgi:hypothetical protein
VPDDARDERVLLALMLPFTLRHPRVFWSVVLAALLTALIARGFKWGLPMPRPAAVLPPDQITVIGWRLKGLIFPSATPARPLPTRPCGSRSSAGGAAGR